MGFRILHAHGMQLSYYRGFASAVCAEKAWQ